MSEKRTKVCETKNCKHKGTPQPISQFISVRRTQYDGKKEPYYREHITIRCRDCREHINFKLTEFARLDGGKSKEPSNHVKTGKWRKTKLPPVKYLDHPPFPSSIGQSFYLSIRDYFYP